jgi:general secretion pathway protein E
VGTREGELRSSAQNTRGKSAIGKHWADEESPKSVVEHIVSQALHFGASDVHLEPVEEGLEVRFRMDGVLQTVGSIRSSLRKKVITRVKVMAELLTYRNDIPQEGRVEAAKSGIAADLRVSVYPTILGEKAVLRLFHSAPTPLSLGDLGFEAAFLEEFMGFLRRPQGVLLLTGPSGSGKTTTIYAALSYIGSPAGGQRNVVTIEDPVERRIRGITQTEINPVVRLDFARGLRSLLRQDPEVIMVGEIRDPETAKIAIEAGLTGHLVISTIHAGTAAGVFNRLLDMGVEPHLVTSAVTAVLAQRLVRLLCPHCRERRPGDRGARRPGDETDPEDGELFRAAGCDACYGTGYRERRLLYEYLTVDTPLRRAIRARADAAGLEDVVRAQGMVPLKAMGLEAVARGETTVEELRRVLVL